MAITPFAVDLSHHDPASDYGKVKSAGIVGVIYKATEGTNSTDNTYVAQQHAAKAAGLKWGAYHFGHPGNIQEQIDNFMRFAAPDPDELFCLDWEAASNGTMSAAEAQQWIEGVERALGRPGECVIYSGNAAKEKISGKNAFFGARRLWLAQYSTTPHVQESWTTWWLWQYTDGRSGPTPHTVPGVQASGVDVNTYNGTAEQLIAEWAAGKSTTPALEAASVESNPG